MYSVEGSVQYKMSIFNSLINIWGRCLQLYSYTIQFILIVFIKFIFLFVINPWRLFELTKDVSLCVQVRAKSGVHNSTKPSVLSPTEIAKKIFKMLNILLRSYESFNQQLSTSFRFVGLMIHMGHVRVCM